MTKINYQALREKAEKATCGVWSLEYGEERFDAGDALIHREVVGYLPICRIEGAHPESGFDEDFQMEQQANAEFIAAANPATVLALLGELETAKKRIAELEAEPVSQTYNLPELIEGMEVSIDVSTCDADLGNRYFGTVTEALELDTAKNGYILLVQDAEPNFDVNGNSPVTPALLPGGFTIEEAKELHEDLVRSHISKALSGEKMKKKDRDADLRWIHGVIVQAAWFVKASLEQNALSGNYPVTPDGWISCSERMPEDNKMLLAFSQGQIVAAYWNWVMSPIDYKKYRTFTYLSGNILDDVTHWMPLPEPPQQDGK